MHQAAQSDRRWRCTAARKRPGVETPRRLSRSTQRGLAAQRAPKARAVSVCEVETKADDRKSHIEPLRHKEELEEQKLQRDRRQHDKHKRHELARDQKHAGDDLYEVEQWPELASTEETIPIANGFGRDFRWARPTIPIPDTN